MTGRRAMPLLLGALVFSGVAGIVNQVVWQRALKIFLGGSETLSAMVVVLVFMLGLGLGAGLASRVAERLLHPWRALAWVELALAVVAGTVAWLLSMDVTESVHAVHRLAAAAGVPLRLVYALGSALLLLGPTMLMGATVPLASEAAQRQLKAQNSRLVAVLFFVNTVGAAVGALGASFWLLPHYGQRASLFAAVACNAFAATVLAMGSLGVPQAQPAPPAESSTVRTAGGSRDEWIGAWLGFLALGYEMVLFRALALAQQPLPTTFATGLCLFLLFWSVGVAAAGRIRAPVWAILVGTALATAGMPAFYFVDRFMFGVSMFRGGLVYVLPCLGFGLLYGTVVSRAAKRWGRDVGRFYAFNTVGSCSGILFFTLVGYELHLTLNALLIATGLLALLSTEFRALRWAAPAALAAMVVSVLWGWSMPFTTNHEGRTYWGRDGVIEIMDENGDVYIDGLWHTKLTDGEDHIGRPYSWVMATAAVLAAGDEAKRALVVGAGVGISSVTLAGAEGMQIDGYEINHTIKRVLRDYPSETLNAANHPNIHWMWQDARVGLALNETKYDIILSAPLHLKQAGSSLLLSKEYMRLAKARLKPGGVLAVYSNEDQPAQAALVQRTLAELFPHRITWYDGVVTLASDRPITPTRKAVMARMRKGDRLAREMRSLDSWLEGGMWGLYDRGGSAKMVAHRPIVDDHPLVEYPEVAERLVEWVEASSVVSPAP